MTLTRKDRKNKMEKFLELKRLTLREIWINYNYSLFIISLLVSNLFGEIIRNNSHYKTIMK